MFLFHVYFLFWVCAQHFSDDYLFDIDPTSSGLRYVIPNIQNYFQSPLTFQSYRSTRVGFSPYDSNTRFDFEEDEEKDDENFSTSRVHHLHSKESVESSNRTGTGTFECGDRIEARYRGKSKYYPGKIIRVRLNGTFDILYDDGEKENSVTRDKIKPSSLESSMVMAKDKFLAANPKNKIISAAPTTSKSTVLKEGDAIEARFRGKGTRWYKGKIFRVRMNGTYDIHYDDGDRDSGIASEHVRLLNAQNDSFREHEGNSDRMRTSKLSVGMRVEAQYRGKARFYAGTIKNARMNGTFDIDYDDGDQEIEVSEELIRPIRKVNDASPSLDDHGSFSSRSDSSEKLPTETEKKITFKSGDKVEAKCRGKGSRWYRGTISRMRNNGTYDVDYDDGDRDLGLPFDKIRRVGQINNTKQLRLSVGMNIEANYRGRSQFEPGKIVRDNNDGTYDILFENGKEESYVPLQMIRVKLIGPAQISDTNKEHKASEKVKSVFSTGDKVRARSRSGSKFHTGIISNVRDDGSYDIDYDDGQIEIRVRKNLIQHIDEPVIDEVMESRQDDAEQVLKEGDVVEAKFRGKGKRWYKGVVTRCRSNGTYDIDYDDGDNDKAIPRDAVRSVSSSSVNEGGIKREDRKIEVGSRVEAKFRGKGRFYAGKIARIRVNGTYDVDYDDGDKEVGLSRDLIRLLDRSPSKDENSNNQSNSSMKDGKSDNQSNFSGEVDNFDKFEVGTKVEARYRGKTKFYPGKIARIRLNGTFDIDYDDGSKETSISRSLIRPRASPTVRFLDENECIESISNTTHTDEPLQTQCESHLKEGDHVEAKYRGESRWYRGKIARVRSNGTYDVVYDNGNRECSLGSELIRSLLSPGSGDVKNKVNQSSSQKSPNLYRGNALNRSTIKGNRWYKGVVTKVKVVHLYEVEYEDGDHDVNIPVSALKNCSESTPLKIGSGVEVLSWQDRFASISE